MKVPYNYLPLEFRDSRGIFKDWKKLIKSTDFTLGKYVAKFEKSLLRMLALSIAYLQIMALML